MLGVPDGFAIEFVEHRGRGLAIPITNATLFKSSGKTPANIVRNDMEHVRLQRSVHVAHGWQSAIRL